MGRSETYIDPNLDIQLPVYSRHDKRSSKAIILEQCRPPTAVIAVIKCSSLPGLIHPDPSTDLRAEKWR